jgi:hypothetical protein
MNVFVVSCSPIESAQMLPDKLVNKMIVESCQMLAVIYSKWYHNWGTIPKKDGTPYATAKGAFRNHPCTVWAAESEPNLAWLIKHGLALCDEFEYRYKKPHASLKSLKLAEEIFKLNTGRTLECWREVKKFTRAMPDGLKYDTTIDDIEAYRQYMNTKSWASDNYVRCPERKPIWMI